MTTPPEEAGLNPVFENLLEATERLWSTRPASQITMRAISAEAGLSVGAAYNYVNSQDELFAAVLLRTGNRLSLGIRRDKGASELLRSLWAVMEANPAFQKLATWVLLERLELPPQRRPVIDDLTAEFDGQTLDSSLTAGMVALLGISIQTFEGLVNSARGVEATDPRLREAVLDMFAAWFETQVNPSKA